MDFEFNESEHISDFLEDKELSSSDDNGNKNANEIEGITGEEKELRKMFLVPVVEIAMKKAVYDN